jgi:RNA polymerase sigma-70 factor (ECF subfamily)
MWSSGEETVDEVRRATERDVVERLYREHGTRLWWAVLAYSGDRDVASDAVAEAFAQLLRRGDQVRSPAAWTWKAAFRIAAGDMKRRQRMLGSGSAVDVPYDLPEASPVVTALGELSPKQRAVVVLHYYAGYPLKEVAAILGGSAATAAVHLSRARKRLRSVLQEGDRADG